MSRRAILIDACLAVAAAAIALTLAGLGVVALIATGVLLLCALSFLADVVARRRRRRRRPRQSRPGEGGRS